MRFVPQDFYGGTEDHYIKSKNLAQKLNAKPLVLQQCYLQSTWSKLEAKKKDSK